MFDSYLPDEWQRIKDIFNDAADLPLIKRNEFLDQACAGDVELRYEVERMLSSELEPGTDALENSPMATMKELWAGQIETSFIGKLAGPFRLLRLVGNGGMGSVYEAVRAGEPEFEQRVAVKVITAGSENRELLRRFRAERQILASLEHPNIARFIDGGLTEGQVPYYAMEYVDGVSIGEYCKTHKLPVNELLELFLTVCAAVSFAHRHLVIHRDLKPPNILVTNEGMVKLLDFGIAKLVAPDDKASTPNTNTLQLAMTPTYASPEQLRGEAVTTTTDVYSLGVILYELLAGRRPHASEESSPARLIRAVCETIPLRPSQVATGQLLSSGLAPESGDRTRLRKVLRGDLDNIVLKALQKDSDRRYSSVEQLAHDITSYLAGRPVSACPDSLSYRALKFFQRNRAACVAAALLFVSLCVGIVATAHQSIVARREKLRAEQRFDDVRSLAHKFVFEYHDRVAKLSGAIELRALMIRDATTYLDHLAQDSVGDTDLQLELARAFVKLGEVQGAPYNDNLGDTAGATESYKKAVALFESLLQFNPENLSLKADLSRAYIVRANLMARTGEPGYTTYIQKSVVLNEELVAVDPKSVTIRAQLVKSYIALADYGGSMIWKSNKEKMDAYRKAFIQAEELCRTSQNDPEAWHALIATRQRLSMNLSWEGKALRQRDGLTAEVSRISSEASEHARRALDACDTLEKLESPNARLANYKIKLTEDLGLAMSLGGDERSISTFNVLLESARTRAQEEPLNREAQFEVALILCFLGEAYSEREQWQDAAIALRQSLIVFDEARRVDPQNGEIPENRIDALLQLGSALWRSGDFAGASDAFDQAESASRQEAFQRKVILPFFRADMYIGRSNTQKDRTLRSTDIETGCGLYRKALEETRTIDFEQGHNYQTFLPVVIGKKLSSCELELKSN